MVGSVNKVILIGRLGADPDVRMTQDDNKIVRLSIATSENWKDKNSGERKEKTEWHRVVIFSPGLANISEKYLKKGSRVYIEGQLQTRKFNDQAGVEKYTTEVVLNFNSSLTMLDTKSEQDSELINSSFPENSEKKVLQEKKNQPENFDIEDEVPF
tara:strand:- start:353 stop:820 length:468 start_codon:yes stop_codon:yes gene_type:complete